MSDYRIDYHRDATKAIRNLHPQIRRRVLAAIGALAKNPRPDGVTKLSGYDTAYRIRIGEYRVIYEVHDGTLLVFVIEVGARGDVYKHL